MRMARYSVMLLIAIVGLVSTAEAKNRDKAWEFGALVQNIDADKSASVNNSIGWELRFGYHISDKAEVEALYSSTATEHESNDDDFVRAIVAVTGNFLTDRETRTIPYISAGLGQIQEKRAAFTDSMGLEVGESFDSSALLMLSAGARSFFSDSFGVRYELRYNHHDSFDQGSDEFIIGVGVTWVVGGEK